MTPQELSRLDYEGASEMLIAHATDAKKYEREIAALKAQTDDWKTKANLAQTKNMPDLAQAALQRAAEYDAKSRELEVELAAIRRDIEDLRSALPLLKAKQRSVDPDQLLAELSMIVGSDDAQFDAQLAQGEPTGAAGGTQGGSQAAQKDQSSSATNHADEALTRPSPPSHPLKQPQPPQPPQPPSSNNSASTSADDALAELKRKMGLL